MNKHKILVIGTSKKTRGGITSVINAHKNSIIWKHYNCVWLETHIDSNFLLKILYFSRSILQSFYYSFNADLCHVHLSAKSSVKRKIFIINFIKLFRPSIKILFHFHGFGNKAAIPKKDQRFYYNAFSIADSIIVLSNAWKKSISKLGISKNKIHVILNPCSNPKITNSCRDNIILYAGTLNSRKNYKQLIISFAELLKEKPKIYSKWRLVFAGNGEIEKAKMIAKDLEIPKLNVEFLGWISGEKKHRLFSSCKIFCLPSYAEGFPMSLLDAWSYEIPSIVSPVGGIPDIAINMKNSIFVDPEKSNTIKDAISLLVTNKKLYDSILAESKLLKNNILNIRSISKQIILLYEDMIK